jgi:hypothetical protein
MRRRGLRSFKLVVAVVAVLAAAPASSAPAQTTGLDDELQAGIRQVNEGDFETAVVTLDHAARRLAGTPARSKDRAQALLYLGVAQIALGQRDAAKASFKDGLAADRDVRPSPDRFSPKVVAAFEEARREAEAAAATPRPASEKPKRRSKTPWLVGLGAAAAGGIVLATHGGDEGGGSFTLTNARFGTQVIPCPDGSLGLPIGFTIVLDARNDTSSAVTVNQVSTVMVIRTSAIPSEIGFASNAPSQISPTSVPAGTSATLRVDSTLTCDNAIGDAPRFNEWSGHLTVTTTAGVVTLDAVDRLRVNIP